MAGDAAVLVYQHHDGVAVAVEAQFVHLLRVPRLFSFHPLFLARAAVIVGETGFYGFLQGLGVHPCDHQYAAGLPVLGDGADQAFFVEFDGAEQGFVYVRHSGYTIFTDNIFQTAF